MNSYSSTLSDCLLLMQSALLDTLDELHTAGLEFTVKRHKGLVIGFDFTGFVCLAEQKEGNIVKIPRNLAEVNKKIISLGK